MCFAELAEVLALADRITVMRDGRTIETMDNDGLSEDRLIRAMVGRDLDTAAQWSLQAEARSHEAPVVLSGEILGIGGLPDSGKDMLGEALFGLCGRHGRVTIDGKELRAADPRASIRNGMALVPADRRGAGALLTMSVANNVVSASLPRFSMAGFMRRAAVRREARAQVARLDARISHLGQKLGTLSGGNQQKNRRAASMSAPRPRSTPSCAASPAKAWRW